MNKKEALISQIMEIEWPMFSSVKNRGGKAACQEDPETFRIIRTSTFMTWSEETLESYLEDLRRATREGRNLMTEKYAHMEGMLEPPAPENARLIEEIVEQECRWAEELRDKHPEMKLARPVRASEETPTSVSSETYARGELATYSRRTLELYHRDTETLKAQGINRIEQAVILMVKRFSGEA